MPDTLTLPAQSPLDRLIATMPDWHSEFGATYANHAPMVLVALDRLGGDQARLEDFFDHYKVAKQLYAPPAPVAALDAGTWESAIGQRDRETDLRRFFQAEVDRLGIADALQLYLPRLAHGVGASALHGLMRLSYALLREDPQEVASGLAYWSACWLEMPAGTGAAPLTRDPVAVLTGVAALPGLRGMPDLELLWHNMQAVGQMPEFAPVVDWLEIGPDTLERMAHASILLFAATQDFCALHAVTGVHWLRIVRPWCPEPAFTTMQRHFWQGIASLMGHMGWPVLPDTQVFEDWRRLELPDWSEIRAKAALSHDEHDLSLTFSAQEEMKVYGDRLYQMAAACRVGLMPAPFPGLENQPETGG